MLAVVDFTQAMVMSNAKVAILLFFVGLLCGILLAIKSQRMFAAATPLPPPTSPMPPPAREPQHEAQAAQPTHAVDTVQEVRLQGHHCVTRQDRKAHSVLTQRLRGPPMYIAYDAGRQVPGDRAHLSNICSGMVEYLECRPCGV